MVIIYIKQRPHLNGRCFTLFYIFRLFFLIKLSVSRSIKGLIVLTTPQKTNTNSSYFET